MAFYRNFFPFIGPNFAPVCCGHLQERHVLGRLERTGNLYGRQESRHWIVDDRQPTSRGHGSQGIDSPMTSSPFSSLLYMGRFLFDSCRFFRKVCGTEPMPALPIPRLVSVHSCVWADRITDILASVPKECILSCKLMAAKNAFAPTARPHRPTAHVLLV